MDVVWWHGPLEQYLRRHLDGLHLKTNESLLLAEAKRLKLKIQAAELEQRWQLWKQQFSDHSQLSQAIQSQGGKERCLALLEQHLLQERALELALEPYLKYSEEELKAWFKRNHEAFKISHSLRLRHVFRATLDRDRNQVLQQMEAYVQPLNTQSIELKTLLLTIHEDPRTQVQGGDLGWASKERLPKDLADALWQLPLNKWHVVSSSIGVHLVQILDRQEERLMTWEEAQDEVVIAWKNEKRIQKLPVVMASLRRSLFID